MLEWISTMPGVPSRAQESTAGLYCWGGKVNDLAPDANAFVHRNADFLFKCEVLWEPEDDLDLIIDNLDWIEDYYAAMQPYLSGGAYQNFTDRSLSDWPRAYYGETWSGWWRSSGHGTPTTCSTSPEHPDDALKVKGCAAQGGLHDDLTSCHPKERRISLR